jgi:hypothetical protein
MSGLGFPACDSFWGLHAQHLDAIQRDAGLLWQAVLGFDTASFGIHAGCFDCSRHMFSILWGGGVPVTLWNMSTQPLQCSTMAVMVLRGCHLYFDEQLPD